MTPLLYLTNEFDSVRTTLDESLRHDYGARDADGYYAECMQRLDAVRRRIDAFTDERDPGIAAQLAALGNIANRVALIERSQLGEFSWPFSDVVRDIADVMLAEKGLRRDQINLPIIHVIAEGTGYNIRVEKNPDLSRRQRIAIVAFPRQLRHHVLMHAIFGHELGHAAFQTNVAGRTCRKMVIPILRAAGPLRDEGTLEKWIRSVDAPESVRERLQRDDALHIGKNQVELWSLELMCDLFGLLIFGASFVCAHRTLLEPATGSTFDLDLRNVTHPPLVVRRRTLVDAMRVLGIDSPATDPTEGAIHDAETRMLAYALETPEGPWPSMFTDDQLREALDAMREVFSRDPSVMASRPDGTRTGRLMRRLARRIPPLLETISDEGVASQEAMTASDCLYAGWAFWFGVRELASDGKQLDFLTTNQLCDQALLQQRAIDIRLEANRLRDQKAKADAAGGQAA